MAAHCPACEPHQAYAPRPMTAVEGVDGGPEADQGRLGAAWPLPRDDIARRAIRCRVGSGRACRDAQGGAARHGAGSQELPERQRWPAGSAQHGRGTRRAGPWMQYRAIYEWSHAPGHPPGVCTPVSPSVGCLLVRHSCIAPYRRGPLRPRNRIRHGRFRRPPTGLRRPGGRPGRADLRRPGARGRRGGEDAQRADGQTPLGLGGERTAPLPPRRPPPAAPPAGQHSVFWT